MKLKFLNALSLAVILAMLFTSVGLADNVQNDVVTGGNDTITAGGSTTISYRITANNGDGQTGCNAADGSAANVTINVPAGVTASPSSLSFTACGSTQAVTFSSNTSGDYVITVDVTDTGTGTYNENPATFTMHVLAPPPPTNTPPSVVVSGVTDGASYDKGSVPAAMCDVTDAEDGNSSFAATLSAITGAYASDDIGSQTASCSYTDGGGLTASASATYSIGDPSAPDISYVLAPPAPDGSNDWYKSDVSLTWVVTENESPNSLVKTDCADQNINADQADTTYSCSATSAGGSMGPVTVSIKRDATLPTISGAVTPVANSNGWNNSDVNVSFTCDDNLSGVASCGPDQTLSGEGASQSATGNVSDNAGNTNSTTVSSINIDKTAPTASASASPTANSNGWNNTDVTVSFNGSDALSGIDSCDPAIVLSAEGASQMASGTCTDKAGNVSDPATATVSIDKTAPTVSLVGGPVDGGTYYFGFVPAAPTCDASDALSGLDGSCSVSGYSNAVGTHTVTASAMDLAGTPASASATYTVSAWTLSGFYQPVDMGKLNTVKGGSTVPLKFEVFAGPTELTSTLVVKTFVQTKVACDSSAVLDEIEITTTGGTSLRYDATAGQFVQNWQTPKQAGACYRVTLTTVDGSSISADFKLK